MSTLDSAHQPAVGVPGSDLPALAVNSPVARKVSTVDTRIPGSGGGPLFLKRIRKIVPANFPTGAISPLLGHHTLTVL